MIRIRLDADAVASARFGISPLGEAVASIAVLRSTRVPPRLSLWAARSRAAIAGSDLRLLFALVQPEGYTPDFLAPEPPPEGTSLDVALAGVAAACPERIRAELAAAYAERELPDVVAAALGGGERALARQASAQLGRYWNLALTDIWPDVALRLERDLRLRAHQLSTRGFAATVAEIHPGLRWADGALEVELCSNRSVDWADGLALSPSVFSQDRLFLGCEPPTAATSLSLLTYPAAPGGERPVPAGRAPSSRHGLTELLGETRARLLVATARPFSTKELSLRQGLSPGTVSYHLGVLHRAGLLDRVRAGREVLYCHSAVCQDLLVSTGSVGSTREGAATAGVAGCGAG